MIAATTRERPGRPGHAVLPRDWPAILLLAVLLGLVPFWMGNDYFLLLFNVMALNGLVVLGLNLLIGSTGQVSLGHGAFYGMGAYLSAIASTTWQWPLPLALLFALALVGLTGYLLALPTLRLEGHYLVMATLGFNIIVSILMGQLEGITGGPSGFPGIPRLHLGSLVLKTDRAFYFFIWGLFLVLLGLTLNLTDSRMGRALQAIHEKDLTAQTLGIPTYRYKVIVFVLSALYAATAGFCYAHYVTFISPKTFDIFYSVQVVTMVVVGGMGSLWGGLVGTVALTCLPELLHRFEDLHTLFYGLILVGVLVFCPQGLLPVVRSAVSRNKAGPPDTDPLSARGPERAVDPVSGGTSTHSEAGFQGPRTDGPAGPAPPLPLLCIEDISLSFGGLQALNEISLDLHSREIVALIGPNGAGKTTLLNVISGLVRPQSGTLRLKERSLLGMVPHRIAAAGIGRTFQAVQIYTKFSVIENVLLGYHLQGRAGLLSTYLHTSKERLEEHSLRERALAILGEFQMADKALWPIQRLSLLEHKVLELVRALALSPCAILLDEPVGGLNPREREVLVRHISLLRERGIGMILVEHDMNVVMQLADRIVVLQHGSKIASGLPREIQRDPKVIEAYLGVRRE